MRNQAAGGKKGSLVTIPYTAGQVREQTFNSGDVFWRNTDKDRP